MECLKCPNFWSNDINEEMCAKCGICGKKKEEKKNG